MICPNCGKEAADGALFCTGCGGRLDNLPKQEKMTASENSNNDDSSVMDAVFTSDAADGTHETNSGNTVAENSDVAGADETMIISKRSPQTKFRQKRIKMLHLASLQQRFSRR